jgi:hypothetical protein
MSRVTAVLIASLLAGYALHAWAQSRIDVRTTVTSIGTSSSNGVSFAWFYDSNERTVYLCRAGQGAAEAIDCKAKAQLP